MANDALTVTLRESAGKGVARKLRAAGIIPGVCYARATDPVAIQLDPTHLERLLSNSDAGMNTIFELKVEGGGAFDGKPVLIKELQRDPVYGRPLHADFYAVDLTQTIHVSVPLHLVGTAIGVEMSGGILDHALRELELECLPGSIPDEINLDVSALDVGDSLHVRDVALPEGVNLLSDVDLSVVSVVAPAVEEVAPVVEEAEGEEGEAAAADAPAEGDKPADDKPAEESKAE